MRTIDMHAHLAPQCFWKATENGGNWHGITREQDARGREFAIIGTERALMIPKTSWTPEQRMMDMDSLGVDVQVVSPYSTFYNYRLDTKTAKATSEDCNDEIYQMTQTWPERFAGLATLPMQDVNAAVSELERVMTQMNFKGAMIDDKINGVTLDHPNYMPFWKAAEDMGALILFHQAGNTVVDSRIDRYHLPNTIGNLADRTITFASLVFGGVIDACPDLKICLSHGGGYTCYGIGRLDRGWNVRPEARVNISKPPSEYLNSFYYDCIVYTEPALRYLIDAVGIERVLFGTDWPFDMEFDWPVSWILSLTSLSTTEKEAILWKNIERALDL